MENEEQNRRLSTVVEAIIKAQEEAADVMSEVLRHGMDIKYTSGKKKEIKVGMITWLRSAQNIVGVKVGRKYDEVRVEAIVEILEPEEMRVDERPEDEDEDEDGPDNGHVSEFDTN